MPGISRSLLQVLILYISWLVTSVPFCVHASICCEQRLALRIILTLDGSAGGKELCCWSLMFKLLEQPFHSDCHLPFLGRLGDVPIPNELQHDSMCIYVICCEFFFLLAYLQNTSALLWKLLQDSVIFHLSIHYNYHTNMNED